ncbi:MAG: tripartite tricarboxylate transporter substrate-binding protein [Treponema sp.]|nr:tripartite tricarboxylate transporter substrate-binding protein [Treponema sp.]
MFGNVGAGCGPVKTFASRFLLGSLLMLSLLSGCSDEAGFFRGKTLTIVVPYGPGGMDGYARALAPYFQKYLPGATVRIENMPGEGGIVGKNFVYSAKPDGLTLCFATSASSLFAEWAGLSDVRFKTANFSFIGRIGAEPHILVVSAKTRFSSFGDILRAGSLRVGFAGRGSDDFFVALATARLLGLKMDARSDYANADDLAFACVRGEVDAMLLAHSYLQPLIDAGTVLPVAVFGGSGGTANRGVPSIFDFAPEAERGLLESIVDIYALDRTLLGPPGLPPSRLAALRRALDRAVADPDFGATMHRLGWPFAYMSGAETLALLDTILKNESSIRRLVRESVKAGP